MNTYFSQTKINFKRLIVRNISSLISNISLPIIFYLVFTRVFIDTDIPEEFLNKWYVEYMISMMVYSATISSIFNTSNILHEDRENQFQLFVDLSSKPLIFYYGSLVPILLFFQLSSFVGIGLVAVLVNQVSMPVGTWLMLMVFLLIVSIPFIVIGYITATIDSQSTLNIVNNIIVFPLAIFGGLWWPVDIMPEFFQKVAQFLPTYYGKRILEGIVLNNNLQGDHLLYLAIMTGILIVILYSITQFSDKKELSV